MGATMHETRFQKHRDALHITGLRPVQIQVPDMHSPDSAKECHRQCLLAAQADSADKGIQQLMDENPAGVSG